MDTAKLALVISVLSLIISLINMMRDRHVVSASSRIVPGMGKCGDLQVTVSNGGKRSISITHIALSKRNHQFLVDFSLNGPSRIDVGDSQTTRLPSQNPFISWNSGEELRKMKIHVVDALGKFHRARFL